MKWDHSFEFKAKKIVNLKFAKSNFVITFLIPTYDFNGKRFIVEFIQGRFTTGLGVCVCEPGGKEGSSIVCGGVEFEHVFFFYQTVSSLKFLAINFNPVKV